MEAETEKKKLRVCAYCRVSTDEDTQASSYELQVQNYTRMIRENPEWEFAGIFADEGISGTSVLHREHFLEMIEKCKAGEIDLIITKQVSRFARNVLDSLNYIFMLRKLDPPVGVYFETEKLNTLDKSSDMVITVLSLVAQSESEQKSNSLKWSFKRRRAQGLGIYPSWALLGYRLDDEKNWEIVEDEADIVRTIYSLYLDGYSSTQIADLLTKSGIPTVKGLSVWSSGSVLGILKNEKFCGDALCQKTVTIDFFTHKSVKNNGIEPQYFVEGHTHRSYSPSISGKRKEHQRYFCQVGWSFYYPCPSPADAPASIRPWLALTNPLYSPFPGHFSFLSSCHAHSSSCSKSFGEPIRYSIFEETVKFGKNTPA